MKNEEIKEILNIFKELTEDYSASSLLDFEEYEIPCIQLKMVLDYITNLQQENKKLKRLKNKLTPEELVNMLNQELVRQNKCYKSRCEKANKFIDNSSHYYSTVKHGEGFSIDLDEEVFCNTLSNILNGSDDK